MGSTMQHDESGCSANAIVAVAEPWAAVQDAAVQWMKGSTLSINSTEDRRRGSVRYSCCEVFLEHIPR